MSAATIRLLLVDDHSVMRAALANLLASVPEFEVVAEADDGITAARLWKEHRPDVCLLDLTMDGCDGIETLAKIRDIDPAARVLMLTSSDSGVDLDRALAAGANGYLTKNVEYRQLFDAIRDIQAGARPVSRDRIQPAAVVSGGLTPRETEVLGLLRDGFTNTEIGRLLGISTHTVKVHVAGVIAKLGVVDRTQAVSRAYELGLLPVRR
jgi:two-component system NarL family response regulator